MRRITNHGDGRRARDLGGLQAGKPADFLAFDRDHPTLPADEIKSLKPVMGGRVVVVVGP